MISSDVQKNMKKHPLEPFWRIAASEAKTMLDNDTGGRIQLVHLTGDHAPEEACIEGSVWVPFAWVMERIADLDDERPIIFVCAVGTRSAFAAEVACSLGKTEVYNLEGGLSAWMREGYTVVACTPDEDATRTSEAF
jgi:rhodanese-related sulfurtransferase